MNGFHPGTRGVRRHQNVYPIMGSTGEFVAPSFVKKPALRQEDDGNRLVFECKLAGNPKPEVSWFHEDVKIQNDERATFKVQEEGRNTYAVILELNDVVETDAGLYKVKAKNKYGEVSASINLNFSREYSFLLVLHFYR